MPIVSSPFCISLIKKKFPDKIQLTRAEKWIGQNVLTITSIKKYRVQLSK